MSAHLFLSHFPLALIVVGALADLLGAATRRDAFRRWAGSLLILGALTAFFTFFTGSGAVSRVLSQPQPDFASIEAHSQWGAAGVWLLVGGGVLRVLWRERFEGIEGWISLAVAVLSAVLVVAISSSGHAISH